MIKKRSCLNIVVSSTSIYCLDIANMLYLWLSPYDNWRLTFEFVSNFLCLFLHFKRNKLMMYSLIITSNDLELPHIVNSLNYIKIIMLWGRDTLYHASKQNQNIITCVSILEEIFECMTTENQQMNEWMRERTNKWMNGWIRESIIL